MEASNTAPAKERDLSKYLKGWLLRKKKVFEAEVAAAG